MRKESGVLQISAIDADQWVSEHGDYLYRFALYRLNNKQAAEDLVQDTFLSALSGLKSYKADGSLRTWFISILKRKIIDYYRAQARQKDQTGEQYFEETAFAENGRWLEEKAPQDWGEHPERALNQNEFREILRRCISLLQKKMALAFTMKEIDELDSECICKELDISTSNLWVLLHRARARLRRCLEKNWFGKEKR